MRSRPGEERELGRGDAAAAIVVRVHREDDRLAAREVPRHPLDLVGVDVRRRHLDGRGQVDDHRLRRRRLPDVGDRVADLGGEVELGPGEALRRVLVAPARPRLAGGGLGDHSRAGDGDVADAPAVEAEDHAALRFRRRVVEVDDRAPRARERLERAPDQRLARLREHLDGDVFRDVPVVDQRADEVVVGLRRRREADLDLLVPHLDQQAEQPQLALGVHRLDQRLVAVAQVDAAPHRRGVDRARGPSAIGERQRSERSVLGRGVGLHGRVSDRVAAHDAR